jgi:hypothetical protein
MRETMKNSTPPVFSDATHRLLVNALADRNRIGVEFGLGETSCNW